MDGSFGPVENTTLEDGTIDLSKLPADTAYVVTELECPGYIVDDAQRIIHLDGGDQAPICFYPIPSCPLCIYIRKARTGHPWAA